MVHKTVAKIGLIICLLYLVSVVTLISTSSQVSVYFLEIVTMLSGMYMVALIVAMPYSKSDRATFIRTLAISFAASCMAITNVVHCIYMTVIQPMADKGNIIPDYLMLGEWPSVIMTADYLAWGLFIGLAFLLSSFTVKPETRLKHLFLINGCLCLAGFFGIVLINENLWYIAPVGYGIGTAVCCVRLLQYAKV